MYGICFLLVHLRYCNTLGLRMAHKIFLGTFLFVLCVVLFSCSAPRTITVSGKVTPPGNVVVGTSYNANVPTSTTVLATELVTKNIDDIVNKDTVDFDGHLERINKALLAYAIDPISSGWDFYIRVGIVKRFELGYKLAGNANTFYAQYQFLGSTGYIPRKNENDDMPAKQETPKNQVYASIGLQYSWQNYQLPDYLGSLQSRLGYRFTRRDVLVPIIFSYSFGPEEKFGSVAGGFTYGYTQLRYTSLPDRVYIDNNKLITGVDNKKGYSSLGAFVNIKFGYKYLYLIPSLSIFYQDYGSYKLINGTSFRLRGTTFVPAISLQARIGR